MAVDNLTIEIVDGSGNTVYTGNLLRDKEGRSTVEGLQWQTKYPKGYSTCSFQFKPKDVFQSLPIQESYSVLIWDGATQVYDGAIETIPLNISESDETVSIEATGPVAWLYRRVIRAHYVDDTPLDRTTWPDGAESDLIYDVANISKRLKNFNMSLGINNDQLDATNEYQELYEMPEGQGVRRVTADYYMRTGETLRIQLYNVDDGLQEANFAVVGGQATTGYSASIDRTFTTGFPRRLRFGWGPNAPDQFDQNDVLKMDNTTVYGAYQALHSAYSSPAYTQGEIVEDLLLLAGTELSSDYDDIGEPGLTLNPFVVDEPTPVTQIINEIALYGDASLNSWAFAVWGRQGTSDYKPKAVFEQVPALTDWEYVIRMNDDNLVGYSVTPATVDLHNYISVQYIDDRGVTRYRTPTDNGTLTDASSVATYGRRDFVIKIGQATASLADNLGKRYLSFHKDPTYTGNLQLRHWIRTKSGNRHPLTGVRAGERYYVPEIDQVFLIRNTSYNADSDTISISPGEQVDGLDTFARQRRDGLRG